MATSTISLTSSLSFSASLEDFLTTNFDAILEVPLWNPLAFGFDPSVQLLGVVFTVDATVRGTGASESLDAGTNTVTYTLSTNVTASTDGQILAAASPSVQQTVVLSPFDGTIDFGGTSGVTTAPFEGSDSQTNTFTPDDSLFDSFIFDASLMPVVLDLSVDIEAIGTSTAAGPGNVINLVRTTATASITVEYLIEFELAGLGDFVFEDANANGVQDSGEVGIEGAQVLLFADTDLDGELDDFIATTTTDENGFYEFTDLIPRNYQVQFVQPEGFDGVSPFLAGGDSAVDSDANPSNGLLSEVISLASGEFDPTIDAGFFRFASLGDTVFNDADADGIQDAGEVGIADATVNLLQNGVVVAATTTDENGNYLFEGLTPGDYQVEFVQPVGFDGISPRQVGGDATVDSDGLLSDVVNLVSGEFDPTIDAGFFLTAGLGDFVFEDLDADGIQDPGEAGIADATVNLLQNDLVVATTTTDGTGFYSFTGLVPGDYQVQFVQPAGFSGISPRQVGGDGAIDSDGLLSDLVNLEAGEFDPTIDAGFFRLASLGDTVFNDADADGIQDVGEVGIADATVNLLQNGVVVAATTTDENGNYLFEGLTPGDYQVEFVQPAEFDGISPRQVDDDAAVDSDGLLSDVVNLVSGEFDPTIDAGFFQTAGLGDFVFHDINANGIQDDGEAGIADATVNLLQNDSIIATTTTDGTGFYSFTGLNPGDYQVQFVQPVGFTQVSPRQIGGDSAFDSDGLLSDVVNLEAGEFDPTIDAGFYNLASLGDTVFNDADADGIQDAGEVGIADATVNLLQNGSVIATTITNAAGFYSFESLIPGDYQVQFVQPDGFDNVSPRQVGGDTAIDSDGLLSDVVTLESGENDTTIDAGFFESGIGSDSAGIDIEKFVRAIAQTPGGGEGLTPGYWKQSQHFGSWVGFTQNQLYESVFGVDYNNNGQVDGPTLLQALGTGEGGANALLRHSTAALLNAANPYVDYAFSQFQIVSDVQSAFVTGNFEGIKNQFEIQNELGADLTTLATGQIIVGDFEDADLAPGITIEVGQTAEFRYEVTNTGTVPLGEVQVTDDRIVPIAQLVNGFNVGDTNSNNLLDPGEIFLYSAFETATSGLNTNIGTVTAVGAGTLVTDQDAANYTGTDSTPAIPQIDIEKFVNGIDVSDINNLPEIAPGAAVTFTYNVTNTGNVAFNRNQVVVSDDNGTPNDTSDDFTPTLIDASDAGGDGILSPGEIWRFTSASQTAQNLVSITPAQERLFTFSGSTPLDGPDGNVRTFTQNGLSVAVSAFNSSSSSSNFQTAYVGLYSSGLGVTNRNEGSGADPLHRVDNNGSLDYLVFEFSQDVIVDRAFLNSVQYDSDITLWIGDRNGADLTQLNSTVLAGFTREDNFTSSSTSRWADFNANELVGDTLIISGFTGGSNDYFKLNKLDVAIPGTTTIGSYLNTATAIAGLVNDSDISGYTNPAPYV